MIYVIGKDGFIGRSLIDHLGDRYDVITIGRADPLPEKFRADDVIVNCACHGWNPWQREDVWETVGSNLLLPVQLEARRNGSNFIHLSASFEFLNPTVPYSRTKGLATEVLKNKAHILYIYTAYGGPYGIPWRFMDSFLKAMAANEPYTISTPFATRDFVHVKRICERIEELFSDFDYRTQHMGHGKARSMSWVAGVIEGFAGHEFPNLTVDWTNKDYFEWKAEKPDLPDTFIEDLKNEWEARQK